MHQRLHTANRFAVFCRIAVIVLQLMAGTVAVGQHREADNWLVGNTWFNFSGGGSPTLTPQSAYLPSFGAGTSISDKNGQLLFYHATGYVFNRQHQRMPYCHNDGNFFRPIYHSYFYQGLQGSLIVPWPGRDSLFFVFHIFHQFLNNKASPLLYSVINMNRDSGLGDVVQPNMPLVNADVSLKMSAVLHCNKKDVWLVGHLRNSDKYFAYLITAAGISPTPVYSVCTFVPGGNGVTGHDQNHYGTMKISPFGDKLAAAHMGMDYIELCDFNNQTGAVSNPKQLRMKPPHANYYSLTDYGTQCVEFSPSGRYLYANGVYYSYWTPLSSDRTVGRTVQFDASLPSETAVQASIHLLDTAFLGTYLGMQLAANGKIYLNGGYYNDYISCVHNPEVSGSGCGFEAGHIIRPSSSASSLPNFIQSYFRYPLISTGNCQSQSVGFNIQNPLGISGINWDFGDPASGTNNTSTAFSPTHIFSTQGAYTVRAVLQNSNGCAADTITKVIHAGPLDVNLGSDTVICSGDTLRLRPMGSPPGSALLWNNNSTDTILKITQSDQYWVRANFGGCSVTDTINISVRPLPQFTLGNDTAICSNNNLTIAPTPTYAGSFSWNNGTTLPTATVNTMGNHWLQITDNLGCHWRDSINVQFKTLPNFSLGNDTAICGRDTLLLNATVSGASGYIWNTGATTPQIKAHQSGVYWCDVNNQGCVYRDSLQLTAKPLPIINLGNDTALCENTTLLLNAQNPNSNYLWNTGSTAPTYLVSQPGLYTVSVTQNNCINRDSINIAYELKPRFTLGTDRLICPGETTVLQPAVNPTWQLLWQNGSTGNTYTVTQPGLYYLDATARCGTVRDEVLFTKGLCKVYIPNAFTPNGDGRNDVLRVFGTEHVTVFHLQIFNRYGQLVFETRDKNKGWDGRLNGQMVNNGGYAYVCVYRELNGVRDEVMKGAVLLIR